MSEPVHILVVGTLPPPLGGASVLVKQLVEGLTARKEVTLTVLNTNDIRGSGFKAPFRLLRALIRLVRMGRTCEVMSLHISGTRGTSPAFLIMGTAGVFVSRLWNKPLIIRTFANRYVSDTQPSWAQRWTRGILKRASLFLVETKGSVEQARGESLSRPEWFPNTRPIAPLNRTEEAKVCRRFVYVGHLRPMKGIPALCRVAEHLPADVTIDAYGTFWDGMTEDDLKGTRVQYCGALQPEEVMPVMGKYDALVLPTLYDSEGYPGVILEAYGAGIPVVASRVGGIPEIVDETSGLLISKGDEEGFLKAMMTWVEDDEAYQGILRGVERKREEFSCERWTDQFTSWCRELRDRSSGL